MWFSEIIIFFPYLSILPVLPIVDNKVNYIGEISQLETVGVVLDLFVPSLSGYGEKDSGLKPVRRYKSEFAWFLSVCMSGIPSV